MKLRFVPILCLCLFFFVAGANAQTNIWNSTTFKLFSSIQPLESMTDATEVTFPTVAPKVTDTIPFPDGFKFHFGIDEYKNFSLSTFGWMKLGAKITQTYYTSEDNIIVPFSTEVSAFACRYKISGTAPNRKFIIEWNGTAIGGNQPVKFQAWLMEGSGQIFFVHQKVNAFTGAGSYYSFCRTKVIGKLAQASINVLTGSPAILNYASLTANNAAIAANTAYQLVPDNIKPAAPSIQFSNVLPGCFQVTITDQSVNESAFQLEKKITGTNYITSESLFSSGTTTTGTAYPHYETLAKPDSLYTFRGFATNGFYTSDTVYASQLTPAPLISGIKSVPGDYASINALLADAECKHLGPDLIIELQPSYAYANEGGTVRFKSTLATKFIHSITVRPAATATSLVISNTGSYATFTIDSLPFVHFDGRAGGAGNNNNLTITQSYQYAPMITYINNANNGGIHYVNIQGICLNTAYGLIYTASSDAQTPGTDKYISGMTINNCKIGPASGSTLNGIVFQLGENNTFRENEFFRFRNNGILYSGGGKNSRFVKNRIYQPEAVTSLSSALGALVFKDVADNFHIDSNRIGGNVAAWGSGVWDQTLGYTNNGYGLIRIEFNGQSPNLTYINNNEFGNITTSGNALSQIYAKGHCVISGNRIGTTDSTASIVTRSSSDFQSVIYLLQAKRGYISNNFISGLNSAGQTIFISVYSVDSVFINNNDVGGSDNSGQNVSNVISTGINTSGTFYIDVNNNDVHGFSSTNMSANGITHEWNAVTNRVSDGNVSNNKVHHLDGKRSVIGIFQRLGYAKSVHIDNNQVYALSGRGISNQQSANEPTEMTAIQAVSYSPNDNSLPPDSLYVSIAGNKIYGMRYSTPSYYYTYPLTGIKAEGRKFRINNNMITLGIDAKGNFSDSIEMTCTGIDVFSAAKAFVEHNSVFIGGKGRNFNYGIKLPLNNYSNGRKDMFFTNNLLQIERKSTTISDTKYYLSTQNSANNSVVANKNIWYSTDDANINSKLTQWRTNCQCDSLTTIADPAFINAVGDSLTQDLHLNPSSVANASGTPSVITIPKDIDNETRNALSPVDIGADAISPCSTGNAGITINPSQEYIEICAAGSLQLSATVTGTLTNLQWQKNLNDLPGETSTTYTVTKPGSYRLTGVTPCGKIASTSVFIIQSTTPPVIKLNLLTPSICDSSAAEFKVEHTHNTLTTLQYKWYRNNVLLPDKITDHEFVDGIRSADRVRVEVINTTTCATTMVKDSVVINSSNVMTSYRPKLNIISYKDSLFSFTNVDTVRFTIANKNGGTLGVIYTTPVASPFHRFVGDSLLIFTNAPESFKFRLNCSSSQSCYYSDTTAEKAIYVSNTTIRQTYRFTGNGNWSNPANWLNNAVPPTPLPFNAEIIIAGSGDCILDVPYSLGLGANMEVESGAKLVVPGIR